VPELLRRADGGEVEVQATTLARLHAEEEVAEQAMEEAAKVIVREIHTIAAREAVEEVAKEAALARRPCAAPKHHGARGRDAHVHG
jgi:hypothetical protein